MNQINFYFRTSEIIRQICKMRIKLARNRSKKHSLHLLTSNPGYNYHNRKSQGGSELIMYQANLIQELNNILPPRKKWVSLGEKSRRKNSSNNEFLTSNDKNFYSLLKTIKLYERNKSQDSWFLNLKSLITEIQNTVSENNYRLSKPILFPELKGSLLLNKDNECRPICLFSFKDRIILSLTNKFLTQLFDDKFQDSSYAFRVKKREKSIISHHHCIEDILEYKKNNNGKKLFVVECDMMKFFDTISHEIVKSKFNDLIILSQKQFPEINLNFAKTIFNDYLDIYCFNYDCPKKTDNHYWNSYRIPNGFFGWIGNNDLSKHYDDFTKHRIGIPQGGALSGLIANIVLNDTDIQMKNYDIFYSRFCDDMIIIGNSVKECCKSKDQYMATLNELKLFPHPFKDDLQLINFDSDDNIYYNEFWKGKSKGPFQWGEVENLNFPWIGFVGYEINYNGEIRIRKKSFKKELKKQKVIVTEIKNAVAVGMRKPKGTVTESAINRLIGMSVGRVGIENFEEVSTDLCWKNGFRLLTINKHSLRQIKQFDRNRSKEYYKLLKDVKKVEDLNIDIPERETIKYNKPFSYYYQILERSKNKPN
ncbi:reverse transcriptase domain-containing protein [Chryseobacterium sp. OV279]|uniref:reverse transcriptase domain-containing protein n=1 Tax=Chryseobacterium sp. OV279 TaxID=1500285 RepID=UPI0009F93C0C|nr:reverse transcriptase domain-containing protein [Chryseobacterium sp. OV279]